MKTKSFCKLASATIGLALLSATGSRAATLLVSENFGGLVGDNLDGTAADTFAAGITTAGGSSTWVAKLTDFRANGSVAGSGGRGSAYINLGSYVNDARGTSDGQFVLSVTVSEVTSGSWLALGFAAENSPTIEKNFTSSPGGDPTTTGASNILRRATTGEIDGFVGPTNGGNVQGPATTSGSLTMSVELDLRLWNGTSNFGTVTFSSGGTSFGGAQPLSASTDDFGSILLSHAGTDAAGTFSSLTLTQVPEPSSAALGLAGLLGLLRRRR